MTDEELTKYLGIENEPKALKAIGLFTPERRAVYERMRQIEIEAVLWIEGLGPKPQGALITPNEARAAARAGGDQ